jgi:polyisoprenyl-phosphate glycosyltransferase
MASLSDAHLQGDSRFDGKVISIMMATYNDWRSIAHLLPELDEQIATLGASAEIIVIDDGSVDYQGKDGVAEMSFEAIQAIQCITLNQNFGNQRAIAIGVAYVADNVKCDYLVIMDSDGEDKPEDLPRLLAACAESGERKIVFAERRQRPEGVGFRFMYFIYKLLFRLFAGTQMSMGNFSVVPGGTIDRISRLEDIWVHYPAGVVRSQLPIVRIPADKGTRKFGSSSMHMVNLLLHAFGGFSVFADRVAVRILIAMLWCIGAFLAAVAIVLWQKYVAEMSIVGWTSQIIIIMLAIMLQIVTGTVLLILIILSKKTQLPLIPIETYPSYIFEKHYLVSRTV